MSKQILKALMQLFAIIATSNRDFRNRRFMVESFLNKQLNQELVKEYLEEFDKYFNEYQEKHRETDKPEKLFAASAVRVLKLGNKLNEELTQKQKIIILFQLFEFSKSNQGSISGLELEFIISVADMFHIPDEEHIRIKEFVVNSFNDRLNSNKILIIDSNKDFSHPRVKHMKVESLKGQIRVLHILWAEMYLIRYIGESGIYLNGQPLQDDKVFVLNPGSAIRNPKGNPIYFSDIVNCFNLERFKNPVEFVVRDLSYKFKTGKTGLHSLSFSAQSGHMVGIMGASGAGKTTLLNTLNGNSKPTDGKILINGYDIYEEKDSIEGLIGYVSQDDLLIEDLTVFQNLYYNARLCFDNYTEEKLITAVEKTLQNLGLYEIRDIQVGSPLNKKISGGQRKRLNIALELIREPGVLFLDEPTSGLSSRDSENIMDLLKELTRKGKLVFVVIHQPSSEIFKMFDDLLILDTGGYLIFNGPPIDAITYFKEKIQHANWIESECPRCGNVNPEQVFNIVEANVLDEYGKVTRTRKISPIEWNEHFKKSKKDQNYNDPEKKELPEISFKIPSRFKQFLIFSTRDILAKLANTQYLLINFLEAPLLAFILAYIIKYYNVSAGNNLGYTFISNSNLPVYIFMSVIVAIFVGLSVSAEEIIKDRKILKREAFLNLSWSGYLLSKVSVLLIISAIQSLVFVLVGNSILEIKEMYFYYWLMLFSAWVSSNIMGLVISDSFKTVVTIYILIPFLVIPQIILSGVIVKYEKLNPNISSPNSIPFYGEIMTARWAYEALSVQQFKENEYDKLFYDFNKIISIAEYKKNYWLPEIRNKVRYLERNLNDDFKKDEISEYRILVQNELRKEIQENKKVKFKNSERLLNDKMDPELINDVNTYIEDLNKFYLNVFKNATRAKDKLITGMQQNLEERNDFLELKRKYHNEKLTEFVENKSERVRIIEYKGRLYQKLDPIYLDPDNDSFLKAHFYAPTKRVFGKLYNTYWLNLIVIWLISIILYIILYFRGLKKLLDIGEAIGRKFRRAEQ